MKKFNKSKSFTLVEILTVVFLGSLIIIAGYAVFLASYQSYKKNTESAELTQNARIALERISREIRQTNQIIPENPPTTSSIKFRDGHDMSVIRYIEYRRNKFDLIRKITHWEDPLEPGVGVAYNTIGAGEVTDEDQIIAQNISALEFIPDIIDPSIITIKISVSDIKNTKTYQFETKTNARNI